MAQHSRRQFLLGAAGTTAGALAGCLGTVATDGASNGGRRTAQASFFVVYDFTRHVATREADVHNLVPFGQHGHGWEPGPDIQRDVLGSDAFVYVGEGFQPWADKTVQNIREDGANVAVVEAWEGVDLLDTSDGHDHGSEGHESGEHDHDDGHSDDGHHEHDGGESGDEQASHTEHGGHADHDDQTEQAGSSEQGTTDPHFWLDPSRAKQSVRTIARGLSEVDPENESGYVENTDAFVERLDELDGRYRERLDGRTRDTVLVAGHNSFRYLGRRYDFHVEALTGLSPDSPPSPQDVKRAQTVIDEHDVEHVLAPVFESDRAARQLVEETDATAVLPLTPVPSLTQEWTDEGWGYVEVMEKVNLPSLEEALGVE
ncbi:zinc ABC transporter substrate-binding protein [Halorarum halophilum]|uniref:Zinc ABC transporter substrate-binding protein n=1 Tax=Halorarum halophilum TaxID=2743090 RepID=A0A7D5GAD1_9EURY|nr:zinc ABC transporter substrate-binding protein [Halobaculum halophilum]QLG26365.1 zinc ABC transporter substrate-binding protein [Halobaculum halophilum]